MLWPANRDAVYGALAVRTGWTPEVIESLTPRQLWKWWHRIEAAAKAELV